MGIYPNNATTKGRVTVGGSITSGIDMPGDKDWFGVELVAGTRYTFTMSTLSSPVDEPMQNIAIEGLIAPDGRSVAQGDVPNGANETAFISYTALESGLYYVPVRGPIPSATPLPDGRISAYPETGSYTLSVAQEIQPADDHGDSPNTATALTLGQPLTGGLNQGLPFRAPNDLDWFSIEVEQGQVFEVETEFQRDNPNRFVNWQTPDIYSYDADAEKFVLQDGNTALQTGIYFVKLEASGALTYSIAVSSPWTFSPEQLAQFELTHLPRTITASDVDLPGNVWRTSHNFGSAGPDNQIIYAASPSATIIGGGGRDVMLGSAHADLLVAEMHTPSQELAARFQIEATHLLLLGRRMDADAQVRFEADLERGLLEEQPDGILFGRRYMLNWADDIIKTDEFRAIHDSVDPVTGKAGLEYLDFLYTALRGVEGTTQFTQGWSSKLGFDQGAAIAASIFASSPEAFQRFGANILPDLIETADADDFGLLYSAYQILLGRAPDATGLTGWGNDLLDGKSIETVVTGILQSLEYFLKNKQAIVDNPQPLETMLENALARLEAPDEDILNSWIRGNAADDVLVAGGGNDVLVGGILSDTFVFGTNGGFNRILDFESWDVIDLRAFEFDSTDEALAAFKPQDGKAVFNEEGTVIVLYGTDPDTLTQDMLAI